MTRSAPAHCHKSMCTALLAAMFCLTGCTSQTVHYYTLRGPSAAPLRSEVPAAFLIDVMPVSIPAELDQPQLVIREGEAILTPLDTERWASPLEEEIRGTLSAELTKQLGTQDVAGLSRPATKPLIRIKVQIRQFDIWPGQRVQLHAGWSLIPAAETGKAALTCFGQFDADAPGDYLHMVLAQRRAVLAMANRIAADARNRARSEKAACSD